MPPAPPPTPNKRVNPFTSQKYSCLWLIKTLLGCHGLGGTANRALSCHQRSQSSSGILPPTPRTPKLEGLPRPQAIPLAKTHTPKDSARKPRAICIFAYNQPFCSREMWKSRRRSRRYPPPSGGGGRQQPPPLPTHRKPRGGTGKGANLGKHQRSLRRLSGTGKRRERPPPSHRPCAGFQGTQSKAPSNCSDQWGGGGSNSPPDRPLGGG